MPLAACGWTTGRALQATRIIIFRCPSQGGTRPLGIPPPAWSGPNINRRHPIEQNRILAPVMLAAVLALSACTCAYAPDLDRAQRKASEVALAGTVIVFGETRDEKGRVVFRGMGSGTVTAYGIVTCAHITIPLETLWVQEQGQKPVKAKVIAEDTERDIALIEAPLVSARALFIRRDETKAGQKVIISGNPHGLMGSVAMGTVSHPRRVFRYDPLKTYLQVDGHINPGNSGGPVVDLRGHLVGISVQHLRGAGIGLAIPASDVLEFVQQNSKP